MHFFVFWINLGHCGVIWPVYLIPSYIESKVEINFCFIYLLVVPPMFPRTAPKLFKDRSSCFSCRSYCLKSWRGLNRREWRLVCSVWKCCRQPTLTLTRQQTSSHIQTQSCSLTKFNLTWPNFSRFSHLFWHCCLFQSWYVRHLSFNYIQGTF